MVYVTVVSNVILGHPVLSLLKKYFVCQVACENTAEATTAGLTAGMNAVELDISVSRDNVVFLWNDPNPADPIAQARR